MVDEDRYLVLVLLEPFDPARGYVPWSIKVAGEGATSVLGTANQALNLSLASIGAYVVIIFVISYTNLAR